MLDHFWKSKKGALKTASLLLKGSRIYMGQALELDPQNETLNACKACGLLKTFLAAKSEIDEHYGSSTNDESKVGEEEENEEEGGRSPVGSQ